MSVSSFPSSAAIAARHKIAEKVHASSTATEENVLRLTLTFSLSLSVSHSLAHCAAGVNEQKAMVLELSSDNSAAQGRRDNVRIQFEDGRERQTSEGRLRVVSAPMHSNNTGSYSDGVGNDVAGDRGRYYDGNNSDMLNGDVDRMHLNDGNARAPGGYLGQGTSSLYQNNQNDHNLSSQNYPDNGQRYQENNYHEAVPGLSNDSIQQFVSPSKHPNGSYSMNGNSSQGFGDSGRSSTGVASQQPPGGFLSPGRQGSGFGDTGRSCVRIVNSPGECQCV